ncbi:MAG: hypothetical protein C0483_17830 [Pirellula sp.]|nr:hypothetical protein [Pirellula sp.]
MKLLPQSHDNTSVNPISLLSFNRVMPRPEPRAMRSAQRPPRRSEHRRDRHYRTRCSLVFACICALIASGTPLSAATLYWDPDLNAIGNNVEGANLGGGGAWNTSTANWWNTTSLAAWPNTAADLAVFSGPFPAFGVPSVNTVTLSNGITANQLSFLRSGYTLTGGDLTLAGTTPTLFSAVGTFATIESRLLGSAGLTLSGGGTIRLSNSTNAYTGTTTLRNGSLIISNEAALGLDTSAIIVTGFNPTPASTNNRGFGGGSLVLDGLSTAVTLSRDISLQGQGPNGDRGAALISIGTNSLSGAVTMAAPAGVTNLNTRVLFAGVGTLNFTGSLNVLGTAATTISTLGGVNQTSAGIYNLSGALTGTGTLEKSGAGTLILAASNSSGFSGTIRAASSAASGQSEIRIVANNVLGSRTVTTTSSLLDMNGGILSILMDTPLVQVTGGANANVYGRASSIFVANHGVDSDAINGTVNFGNLIYEDNITLTFNSRNGYGFAFTTAPVSGGNADSGFANNLGGLLTFTGNFWSNSDAGNRTMTISGNGNTLINGNIIAASAGFAHNLTKTGAGVLTLAGTASTIDGAINVNGGTVAIRDFGAVNNNTGTINIGTGTTGAALIIGVDGFAPAAGGLTTSKTINMAGTTGSATIYANQSGSTPVVLNADFGATGGTAANAKTLVLGGTNTADNLVNGVIPNNDAGGSVALRKIGGGTWVLAGANTFSGAVTLNDGTLKLKANAATSTILLNSTPVTFDASNAFAGSTLEFVGQAATNNLQTLGALTVTNGANTIKLTPGVGGTASLSFASISIPATGAAGGSVNFFAPTSADTIAFAATGITNNILHGGAYYSTPASVDFAFVSGAGIAIRAPVYGDGAGSGGSDIDFVNAASSLTTGMSNQITASLTNGAVTIDSLKISGGPTLTLTGLLTVRTAGTTNASGGILQTGGSAVIAGTGISTGGSGTLMIRVDGASDTLELSAPITSTTTGGFTKSGAGTLLLSAANALTGTISINEGTVKLSGVGRIAANNVSVTMRQGATIDLNGVTPSGSTNSWNNNGTLTNTSATAVVFNVGGSNGTGTSFGSFNEVAGRISIVKTGSGAQSWLGLSNYTGSTTIGSTGLVTVETLADIGEVSGIGRGDIANNAGSLIFNGSTGGLVFAGNVRDGELILGSVSMSTNRLFTLSGTGATLSSAPATNTNNAIIWSNTGDVAFGIVGPQLLTLTGTSQGDNTFNPRLTDSGTGLNITSVTKTGTGIWELGGGLTGNTYSGATTITQGILIAENGKGLSLNSNLVFDGGILQSQGLLTRNIGTAGGEMQFATPAANTAQFSGGFAGGDSKLTVTWSGVPVWGSTAGFLNTRDGLILQSSQARAQGATASIALSEVDIAGNFSLGTAALAASSPTITTANGSSTVTVDSTANLAVGQTLIGTNIPSGAYIISINSATQITISANATATGSGIVATAAAYALRPIRVDDNTNAGSDFATISGVISGTAGSGIRKLGAGFLRLSGANTYSGETNVYQGTLIVASLGNSAGSGTSSVGTETGANLDSNAVTLGNGGTGGGILQYMGAGETSDRKIRLNSTTGNSQIHADGAGAIVLTNVANDMVAGAKTLFLRGTNAGGNMITSTLSDNGGALGITIDSSATWILTGANDYSGTTTVSGGALGIGNDTAVGVGGNLDLSNGTTFAFGADRTVANPVRIVNNATAGFMGEYSLTFTSTLQLLAAANNVGLNNNIAPGKSVTFGNVTAESLTAARTWSIDGSGDTIVTGNITTTTGFNINLTKNGSGSFTLGGTASTFNNGVITIANGTFKIGADNVLNFSLQTNLVINPAATLSSTLDVNGFSDTIRGLAVSSAGSSFINNSAATAGTLSFGKGDQAVSFAGSVINTGTGALSLTKIGTASALFTGGTYAHRGATNVTGGSLVFAGDVSATTAVSVTGGSTLEFNNGFSASTGVTSLEVGAGSSLTLDLDLSGTQLLNLTSLSLGNTGTGTATLNLNVGDLATAGDNLNTDLIRLLNGGTLNLGGTITFNLTDAGMRPNQTYTLLNVVNGGLGAYGFSNLLQGLTPGGFASYAWITTDNLVQLQVGGLLTGSLYWRGLTNTAWNGAANNWSLDKAGTNPSSSLPGSGSDVVFQWNAPTNAAVSTTLEQNFTINSLTFEAATTPANTPTAVTIAAGVNPAFRLQVSPQTPTDGVKITTGGPAAVTISSPFSLGANQTWSVADSASVLTFSGALQGEQDVTVSGAGTVVLSAVADPLLFNPGLTADFTIIGGALELRNVGALGTTAADNLARVVVNGGGFYYNNATSGNVANPLTLGGGALSAGSATQTYSGTVNITAPSTVNMRNNNSAVVSTAARSINLTGVLSGTGKLTVDSVNTLSGGNQLTGSLTLSNDNSGWSGGLDLLRGTVAASNVNALGTGNITATLGRIQFLTAGGTSFDLAQNITVDAVGGILELSADASGTPTSDMSVNLNGIITLGSTANANNALRFSQATDNFSVFHVTNSIVLGNNASISYQGTAARFLDISAVISETGGSRNLTINDELGGWAVTSRTIRLSGASTFTGDITVAEGGLEFTTVSNIGGPASSLGRGSAITLAAATLTFVGADSQSTDRTITTTGSATLFANGSAGAVITYAGAVTQAADNSLTLNGTGAGRITGGITQPAGGATADLVVTNGTWTIRDGNVTIADDLLLNGGTLNLEDMVFSVNDDVVATGGALPTVLNLNSTGVLSAKNPAGASTGLYARAGAIINLNANDVYGVGNSGGLDFINLGDATVGAAGVLNTNSFNITTPGLLIGAIADGLEGQAIGSGTITVTSTATDYGSGIRTYRGAISANLAGVASLLKQGLDDVTLSGDNSGLTGTVAATRIDSGRLILDFTSDNHNKISSVAGLDMQGGTLVLNGNASAATAQAVASLTLSSGGSNRIVVNAGVGQDALLDIKAVTRANGSQDGTIRFVLPAGTQTATNGIITNTLNTNGLLGTSGFATVDDGTGTWFATNATNTAGGNIVALISTLKNDVATWQSGDHVTDGSAGFSGTLTGSGINSLRFDAAAGSDLAMSAGGALYVATGGILVTSNVTGSAGILNGTLASGAAEIIVTQDNASVFEISADIRINHSLTKSGVGTLLLSGNNVYTDETEIQEGTVQVTGGNAIGDTSLVTLGNDHFSTLQLLADETIGRLAGGSATTGLNLLAVVDIGAHTLTINQNSTSSATYSGLIVGSGDIVKLGSGNELLNNNSSGFTGTITINGGLFYFSGIGASAASSITINKGGTFLLDNTGSTRSGSRVLDTTPITLNSADGTFSGQTIVRGLSIRTDVNATTNETIGALNFNSGANYLSGEASGSTGIAHIIADNFVRANNATVDARGRNMGGTASDRNQFKIGPAANETAFIGSLIGGGGGAGTTTRSIVPWGIGESISAALADTNMGNSLITYVAAQGFVALDLTTDYAPFSAGGNSANVRENLTADNLAAAGRTLNALVIHNNNTTASTVSLMGTGAGQSLVNTSGTFLFTLNSGAAAASANGINLGGFDDGISVGSTNEYVVFVVNPSSAAGSASLTATISSPLTSNADITKSGRGTLILTAVNTAGGGARKTTINEGILEIADLDNIGGNTGALVFAGGTLRLGSSLTDDISLRAITLLGGGGTIDTNGISLVLANSVGSGSGGFTKTGAGNLTLNAAANYTGATSITGGTLTLGVGNAIGVGNNLSIGAGATFDIGTNNVAVGTMTTSGAGPVISGTGTITAASGFFFNNTVDTTISAVLAGSGGLLKTQTNVLTLSNANTFSGPVELQSGTLSFASVDNVGGAASALGAPTTVESGIIRTGLTTTSVTLTYTGLGSVTDRIVEMQGTTGGLTINANGSGSLGLGTIRTITAGTKTLTLGGTSTGVDNSVNFIQEIVSTLNLSKTGTSTWVLLGPNTYTGTTTLTAGVLKVGSDASLSTAALGLAGGTLDNYDGNRTISSAVTLTGVSTLQGSGNFTFTGNWSSTGASRNLIISNVGTMTIGDSASDTFVLAENNQARTVTISVAPTADATINAVIQDGTGSGADALTKNGLGRLILMGPNTYTGATTVGAGILGIGNNSALGTTANGTTVAAGASLELQGDITVGAEPLSITGTGTATNGALRNLSGNNIYGGTVTLTTGGATIQSDAGLLTLSAANSIAGAAQSLIVTGMGDVTIAGAITTTTGSLTMNGLGKLTLSGANTYSGGTALADGIVQVDSLGALGTAGSITFSGGTLQYSANNAVDYSARFSTAANQLFRIDTNSQSVSFGTAFGSAGSSLTKLGLGNLTLTNTPSYSGATNVYQGSLTVNTALNNSSGVNVGNAATPGNVGTFNGTGPINAPVVVNNNGVLSAGSNTNGAAGNGVGALPIASSTWNAGASVVFDFQAAAGNPTGTEITPGTNWDYFAVSGALNLALSPGDKINLYLNSWNGTAGYGTNSFDPTSAIDEEPNAGQHEPGGRAYAYTWKWLAANEIQLNGSSAAINPLVDTDLSAYFNVFTNQTGDAIFGTGAGSSYGSALGGQFWVSSYNNALYINYSAVPEPGSLLMVALAGLGFAGYRRRKRRTAEVGVEDASQTGAVPSELKA